ncbi:MAG: SRPBCC family protein [Ignavibacteriaceae bacterium]|nr:SRPBCC family protein [Ignavibacteriaceae bacterium]
MHELRRKQKLPISLEQGWDFLSSPENLKKITPPHMGFEILSGFSGEKMYAGMIINYIVKPFPGVPMNWTTEITHVSEPNYFVDEQRFGPYTFWHHKHFIKEIPGGVEMEDLIHYKLPFGPIGKLVNALIVKHQLNGIFRYREKVLTEMFGKFE